MTDRKSLDAMTSDDLDQLYAERDAARATNRRLNLRAQRLESELATYRRAVDQWEIRDDHTYVPLRTIAVIAKAAGRNIENPRWLMHYQRIEQAETALRRARDLHRETCPHATGSVPPTAFACSMCDTLNEKDPT